MNIPAFKFSSKLNPLCIPITPFSSFKNIGLPDEPF
jgi:hypothetical protein